MHACGITTAAEDTLGNADSWWLLTVPRDMYLFGIGHATGQAHILYINLFGPTAVCKLVFGLCVAKVHCRYYEIQGCRRAGCMMSTVPSGRP